MSRPNPLRPLGDLVDRIAKPGRAHRRHWVGHGRAHIEVRGVHRPGFEHVAESVERELGKLKGVDWAQVNAITGSVVVMFDGGEVEVDDLIDTIGEVEELHGVHKELFPHERPEHPGDVEPLQRNLVALGASCMGIAASAAGQFLRLTPVPAEFASAISVVENEPHIRRVLDARLGRSVTDLGLGVTSAVAQGLAHGPLGLVADACHRLNATGEVLMRRRAWHEHEPELAGRRHGERVPALNGIPRPKPLRSGAIERYSNAVPLASMAAFGAGLGVTRDVRKSANLLAAGVPKAARLGRESFSAQLDRELCARGMVTMDPGALRRLDRIDALVLDAAALETGRHRLAALEPVGRADPVVLTQVVAGMFDPVRAWDVRSRGGWRIGPLDDLGVELPKGAKSIARRLGKGRARAIGVASRGRLAGIGSVVPELDPYAEAVIAAGRGAGLTLVIAGARRGAELALSADRVLPGGKQLADSVRALQGEGLGVLLVSGGERHAALGAADVGVGMHVPGARAPWGADVICGPSLQHAYVLVKAVAKAREVSRASVAVAATGSGIGGVWAMIGPSWSAGRRAMLPVNAAALATQAYGLVEAGRLSAVRAPAPTGAPPWHAMDPKDVLAQLGASTGGLSTAEAERRAPPAPSPASPAERLLRALGGELANPLTPVLALGAGLAAAVGSVTDAALVGGVVAANAVIGAAQALRTEASLTRLIDASIVSSTVRRRDGVKGLAEVHASHIVPGDVLELSTGDMVPADCRILDSTALEVDESSLTGESLPVGKSALACTAADVADRSSMLYEGSSIAAGECLAVVVATGPATVAGQALALAPQPPPSGVETRLAAITRMTLPVTIASGGLVSALGFLWRRPVAEAVGSGVSLMVAAVPEGLPLLANAAQLSAAHRLSERAAIVRNPRTIEALGRVDVLCFDKTGTLTAGRISLQRVSDGAVDEGLDELTPRGRDVLGCALRASPRPDGDGSLPHATDRAIVEGAGLAGASTGGGLGGWQPLAEVAFEAARGFHAVVGATGDGGRRFAAKGAPEVLLPCCTTWRSPEGNVPLDGRARASLDREVERLAGRGLRVLAVAERACDPKGVAGEERLEDMELVGFVGLADGVRASAAEAVAGLVRAGVTVRMVTGDHPATARAIATELGLANGDRVVTGQELDALSDAALDAMLAEIAVFARVTPVHKVRIVEAYQRAGHVVAMTGDGANDAPAIRLAHVGIAMARRGSPSASQAADLVVTDDRLETIIAAIIEGRAMWTSVRDALAILIGGNLGEVAFTVVGSALTGRSPLSTRQLLLVNMLTDMLPAMTIALRPPADRTPEELLHEGPDASLGGALAREVALRAATTASSATGAWLIARATGTRRHADTVALAALVGSQLAQTAVVGGRSPIVLASTVASAAALGIVVQTPGLSRFFGCTPLGPLGWSIATGSAALSTGASVVAPRLVQRLFGGGSAGADAVATGR